jgi:hypothetical protein
MNPTQIAVATGSAKSIPSRRAVLRSLAGLGFGVGAWRLSDPARAKKGKKKRKPRKRCPRGKRVAALTVPGTGAEVLTPTLRQGQPYRVRASGYWRSNATRGQDAFADFSIVNPDDYTTNYEGVRLGLVLDNINPDLWGDYTPAHEYERVVTGRGTALSLRSIDTDYADNSGALFVEIFCA